MKPYRTWRDGLQTQARELIIGYPEGKPWFVILILWFKYEAVTSYDKKNGAVVSVKLRSLCVGEQRPITPRDFGEIYTENYTLFLNCIVKNSLSSVSLTFVLVDVSEKKPPSSDFTNELEYDCNDDGAHFAAINMPPVPKGLCVPAAPTRRQVVWSLLTGKLDLDAALHYCPWSWPCTDSIPTIIDETFGGQILRTAVACAAITCRPVHVNNIRAGRPKPGLSNQHLTGIILCAEISGGELSHCRLGSTELRFKPRSVRCGTYEADAKTAGSISLLLQVALPVLAYAGSGSSSILLLKGGTDAQFAPPVDYMSEITLYFLEKMGLDCKLEVIRRGFYPQGGGVVKAQVHRLSSPLLPITMLDPGPVDHVSGYAFVAGRVPLKIAHEMERECVRCCSQSFPSCPVKIRVFREDDNRCTGNVSTFLFIVHTKNGSRLAVSGLGNPRGPHHTKLVQDAIASLTTLVHLRACCDDNMQDQFVLPMALASGRSEIRTGPLTLHTKTAIYVVEQLLG
ncbi:RNA 3'-terminal phosphate cyclase, partial [Clonorchis sinensis]